MKLTGLLKYALAAVVLAVVVDILVRPTGIRVPKEPSGIITYALERNLLSRLIARGGMSLLVVGRRCPTCPRGTFASRSIVKDEVVLSVPLRFSVALKKLPYQGYAPEYAYYLAIAAHMGIEFNRSHPYFWETLPAPEDNLDLALMSDEELLLLQDEVMIAQGQEHRRLNEAIYYGSAEINGHTYQALPTMLRSDGMTLETFGHLAALVRSRDFIVHTQDRGDVTYLLPIMDMINHEYGDRANVGMPKNNGTHMTQRALRAIAKGEEMTWNYNPNTCHRNDIVMITYGFVLDQEPPLLPSYDIPDFEQRKAEGKYPESDEEYYGPGGNYNTVDERMRLNNLLNAMPTTVEEDEVLLKSGTLANWKEEMLVRYRMARKRALRRAIGLIENELGIES